MLFFFSCSPWGGQAFNWRRPCFRNNFETNLETTVHLCILDVFTGFDKTISWMFFRNIWMAKKKKRDGYSHRVGRPRAPYSGAAAVPLLGPPPRGPSLMRRRPNPRVELVPEPQPEPDPDKLETRNFYTHPEKARALDLDHRRDSRPTAVRSLDRRQHSRSPAAVIISPIVDSTPGLRP